VIDMFADRHVDDNGGELNIAVHRMQRVKIILGVLVHQMDIMETMTPLDFLDFRDLLRPASGFQSMQFKILEARLGLRMEARFGKQYYTSQLKPEHKAQIEALETMPTLLELVNKWLERMPFLKGGADAAFWQHYKESYRSSLAEAERNNLSAFDQVFADGSVDTERSLSPAACRAALFIMLYRGYPLLQLPFQLLNCLLEIDEQLSSWRYRHMNMVHRMIGMRIGTGGSTGKDYLKAAADKHYIFKEIAQLNSFLMERRKLPVLPSEVEEVLGFRHG
jgi:tryptophan 2,3-dioxygenase